MPRGQSKKKEKGEEAKPRKKPTKVKKPPVPAEESEEEDSDDEKRLQVDDGDAFKIKYVSYAILMLPLTQKNSWKEDGFSEKLLAAITDDPRIKQGLFPSPGAKYVKIITHYRFMHFCVQAS